MAHFAIPTRKHLVWIVLFLLLFGQVMLFSATGVAAVQKFGSEFYYVFRQGIAAFTGFWLMMLLSKVKYEAWAKAAYVLMALLLVAVIATYLPGIGHRALGAARWIRIQGFIFQPSELAKIIVPIYTAKLLSEHQMMPFTRQKIILAAAPLVLLLALIFRQPDLGTTTLLVLCCLSLFFISGMRLYYFALGLALGAVGFVFALFHYEYRRKRLMAFLNPWADPQGSGFQTIQSFLSFYSGGFFGTGIGNGNSKLFFLPEVHTDFIFALVGEELGFVGAILLLALFVYFSYLLFKTAFRAPTTFGSYLAFGLSFLLVAQVAVNIGGVTGLLPVKGLPLPFISWGRSALLVNLSMVGILLNIARQSENMSPPCPPIKR